VHARRVRADQGTVSEVAVRLSSVRNIGIINKISNRGAPVGG